MNHLTTRGAPRFALRCALGFVLASSMLLAACGGTDATAPSAESSTGANNETADATAEPASGVSDASATSDTRARALADSPTTAPPATASWTWCANEGGVCTVPAAATVTVRYGANSSYHYRSVSGSIACSNGAWGDPIFGTAKSCGYTTGAAATPAPGTTSWVSCAGEGGVCSVPSPRNVRYGANGSYYYKTVSTAIACSNGAWGDPISGIAKSCAYESSTAAPVVTPGASWVNCASEGGVCAFSGTRSARYGANGVYYYRTVTASIACSNAAWGGDPVVGVAKSCAYDSATTAVSPTPTPTPPPATTVGTASLAWSASSDSRVTGYRVYWGTAPGSYQQARGVGLAAGTATSYTVSNLPAGRTYYFAVTAYDASGTESTYSSEASKAIP